MTCRIARLGTAAAFALAFGAPTAVAQRDGPGDILALRQLLVAHEFGRLDSALSRRQLDATDTPANETRYAYAYDAFESGDSTLRQDLDAWVVGQPTSPRARIARGTYFMAMAWKARGGDWARNTRDTQFEQMHDWLKLAIADAARASRLDSTDVAAYSITIAAALASGSQDVELRALDRALALSPTNLRLRSQHIHFLRPRWGGSKEEMDRFAEASQQYADRNPRLRVLLGYSMHDHAQGLEEDKSYEAAIDAYTKALTHGDFYYFRTGRARTHMKMVHPEPALVDFNHAIADRPGNAETLGRRAMAYYYVAHRPGAMKDDLLRRGAEDMRIATALDSTNSYVVWARKYYVPRTGATSSSPGQD